MKPIALLLTLFPIVLLAVLMAAADIHTSNVYYAGGRAAGEDAVYHNMDFTNIVNIYPDQVISEASGIPSDDTGTSRLKDAVFIKGSQVYAFLEMGAKEMGYQRLLQSEKDSTVRFSYNLRSGQAHASYFNGITSVKEDVLLDNNGFISTSALTPTSISLNSAGNFTGSLPSSFSHRLSLIHAGKPCEIDARGINPANLSAQFIPISYQWTSFASSDVRYAASGIDILFPSWNKSVDKSIDSSLKGRSINDKLSPSLEPKVLFINRTNGQSKELYMRYMIAN